MERCSGDGAGEDSIGGPQETGGGGDGGVKVAQCRVRAAAGTPHRGPGGCGSVGSLLVRTA